MKITKVETFAIKAPNPSSEEYWGKRSWVSEFKTNPEELVVAKELEYPAKWRMRASYSETIDTCLVKIHTDEGYIGWGESKAPVAPSVSKTIIDELLTPIILNRDPFDVDVLWEEMYSSMRLRGHLSGFFLEAISGVDIALWDLMGKKAKQPIHKLLGGAYRSTIEVYGSGVPGLRPGADQQAVNRLIKDTQNILDKGFNRLKIAGGHGLQADIKTIEVVRETVGDSCTIFLDAAGNYDLSTAHQLGVALHKLGVQFLEAPVPPEYISVYGQLAKSLEIPIASDLITSRYQALDYFQHHGLDMVQPDICRAGGISECRKIAVLADTYGVGFAPHISIGSVIHFAASAHLAAAIPNFKVMEYWVGENPLGNNVLTEPFGAEQGLLKVPEGYGLGIQFDEAKLLKHSQG